MRQQCTTSGMTTSKACGQASLARLPSTTGSSGCTTWQRKATKMQTQMQRKKQKSLKLTLRTLFFVAYSILVTMNTYVGDPIGVSPIHITINNHATFLAVHNSSIGDLVTHSLSQSLTESVRFLILTIRVTLETCDLQGI